ncbi:MAG: NUDIX hydrolase [Gordonia sp. (in: high G+C Gram-positive bacteria)]|uniref:NUDIX hydrolase n=1 Tax=Gordonia sp. (in: high G+C Gram-positive bacteria) TaxID=84139 RepID=UPI0039E43877
MDWIGIELIVGVAVVALLLILLWAYRVANRLDRLHVRTDLARQALVAALDRRAVVSRAIAVALRERDDAGLVALGVELAGAADLAEAAPFDDREDVENELSILLGKVGAATKGITPPPVELIAEISDAQTRVIMARRFYNDAVRDTLALAGRRAVRWFRLGGHAPLPAYFEIVDRVTV